MILFEYSYLTKEKYSGRNIFLNKNANILAVTDVLFCLSYKPIFYYKICNNPFSIYQCTQKRMTAYCINEVFKTFSVPDTKS